MLKNKYVLVKWLVRISKSKNCYSGVFKLKFLYLDKINFSDGVGHIFIILITSGCICASIATVFFANSNTAGYVLGMLVRFCIFENFERKSLIELTGSQRLSRN